MIEKIYLKLEKDHFLSLLSKTLEIQNNGGDYYYKINKKIKDNPITTKIKKTCGGVFFATIKKEAGLSPSEIKELFSTPSDLRRIDRANRKIMKELEKLNL